MRNLLILLAICLKTLTLRAQQTELPQGQSFLIQVNPNFNSEDFLTFLNEKNIEIHHFEQKTNSLFTLEIKKNETSNIEFLKNITSWKGIELAQTNSPATLRNDTPNDPDFVQQWHLARTRTTDIWKKTKGGTTFCGDTLVVAVVDWGFDTAHTDLRQNIWQNKSEIPNNNLDDDQNGYIDDRWGWNVRDRNDRHTRDDAPPRYPPHGTACAGVIGAVGNNGQGATGVNWNIKLLLLSEARSSAELAAAMQYIVRQRQLYRTSGGRKGAMVVAASVSVGINRRFPDQEPVLCAWADSLQREGIVLVNAPPNQPLNIETSGDLPALCPNPLAINLTSTDQNDRRKDYAIGKNTIHIAAPGSDILTTFPRNNSTDAFSGNSFAAPQVAGAVALLWAAFDTLCKMPTNVAAALVREAILKGGDPLPTLSDVTTTGKRLNLVGAQAWLTRRLGGAGVGELSIEKIFPNPAKNIIFLNIKAEDNPNFEGKIYIQNALGQIAFVQPINAQNLIPPSIAVHISTLSAGFYTIWLETGAQISIKKTFIVL